jgi:Uma2 family endonuclease
MSTAALPLPTNPTPGPRYWTRDEFYRLAELGFFRGQRAERLGGQIMVQSPQNWPHACATDRAGDVLRTAFGPGFWVRTQLPLALGQDSDPEPDVSVVRGRREDYTDHPTAAVLVVEVADSTLSEDRDHKLGIYAAAGVPEYWIVNLIDRTLEVYLLPRPDPVHPSGWAYSPATVLRPGRTLSPLGMPNVSVAVGDLLP